MEFTIKKENEESVKLDRRQLLDILFGRVVSTQREDFVGICSAFSEYVQEKRTLGQMTPEHLMTIAFATGYYYRIFLEKNEVKITDSKGEKIELVNEKSNESADKRPAS